MKISEVFGGSYLCGEDFPAGKSFRLTVGDVRLETFDDGQSKPVMAFTNARKSLVLNKTNSSVLSTSL